VCAIVFAGRLLTFADRCRWPTHRWRPNRKNTATIGSTETSVIIKWVQVLKYINHLLAFKAILRRRYIIEYFNVHRNVITYLIILIVLSDLFSPIDIKVSNLFFWAKTLTLYFKSAFLVPNKNLQQLIVDSTPRLGNESKKILYLYGYILLYT